MYSRGDLSSKLRVAQGKKADLCIFQVFGIRLCAHCYFFFQFGFYQDLRNIILHEVLYGCKT